jgi:hypothetical protein
VPPFDQHSLRIDLGLLGIYRVRGAMTLQQGGGLCKALPCKLPMASKMTWVAPRQAESEKWVTVCRVTSYVYEARKSIRKRLSRWDERQMMKRSVTSMTVLELLRFLGQSFPTPSTQDVDSTPVQHWRPIDPNAVYPRMLGKQPTMVNPIGFLRVSNSRARPYFAAMCFQSGRVQLDDRKQPCLRPLPHERVELEKTRDSGRCTPQLPCNRTE